MVKREIKYIVFHCTATAGNARVSSIRSHWKNKLGWKNPGYHFLIDEPGNVYQLQPLDRPANGVKGYNAHSIHISYIGGIDEAGDPKDTRTRGQYLTMTGLLKALHGVYPEAVILGHRDFEGVKKACPSFEVKEFRKEIDL